MSGAKAVILPSVTLTLISILTYLSSACLLKHLPIHTTASQVQPKGYIIKRENGFSGAAKRIPCSHSLPLISLVHPLTVRNGSRMISPCCVCSDLSAGTEITFITLLTSMSKSRSRCGSCAISTLESNAFQLRTFPYSVCKSITRRIWWRKLYLP